MLHYETIDARTLDLLKRLQTIPEFQNLRLVGGTALALQLGHRISVDLDLFGTVDVGVNHTLELLECFSDVQLSGSTKKMMFFNIDGVKVDIVNYPSKDENGDRIYKSVSVDGGNVVLAYSSKALANMTEETAKALFNEKKNEIGAITPITPSISI